jgi:hypothetical protein
MEVTALGVRALPSGAKTADSRAQARSSQAPSFIPQFSPKTAARSQAFSSSLPSSLNIPHLGLVHPNRTPSVNGPPSQATIPPPSAPSSHTSSATSLPLRALRSFLPFGSGKPASATAAPGPSKSPFAGFASSVRRSSTTIERKNSDQFPRLGDDKEVTIASSPQASPERLQDASSSAGAHEPPPPSGSASHGELGACENNAALCTIW